jgi:hypothetical protein
VQRGAEGTEGAKLRSTQSAVAFDMMCPTLFLRPLKKIARLEKSLSEDLVSIELRQLTLSGGRMREKRTHLLRSWAKAKKKDNESSKKATRSEGDNLEESATRALMRHWGNRCGWRERHLLS